jgi:hypothetical protein
MPNNRRQPAQPYVSKIKNEARPEGGQWLRAADNAQRPSCGDAASIGLQLR